MWRLVHDRCRSIVVNGRARLRASEPGRADGDDPDPEDGRRGRRRLHPRPSCGGRPPVTDAHSLTAKHGSAKHPDRPVAHQRPPGVSDAEAEALGKLGEALEAIEYARGHLYGFHRLSGTADLT